MPFNVLVKFVQISDITDEFHLPFKIIGISSNDDWVIDKVSRTLLAVTGSFYFEECNLIPQAPAMYLLLTPDSVLHKRSGRGRGQKLKV